MNKCLKNFCLWFCPKFSATNTHRVELEAEIWLEKFGGEIFG